MSVKINLNQPQEKCFTDLFNAANEGRLGVAITPEDIVIGRPQQVTGAVNSEVIIEARGIRGIKGSTRIRYNRLRLQDAPLPSSGLLVTVTTDDQTTVDLCGRINKLMKIQLKESDIISEALNVKQLPYGSTDSGVSVNEECLVYLGRLPIKLVREEPEALTRADVVFPCWDGIVASNDHLNKTHGRQKEEWELSSRQGAINDYTRVITTLTQDPFAYRSVRSTLPLESDPLAFWYRLYPETRPSEE